MLGDDGDWRRLDVAGLTPVADGYDRLYTSSVVRPTGLDPSGTTSSPSLSSTLSSSWI